VCSQFHRGRLLISWDPNPSYFNNDGHAGQQISDVLDLASANELVFKVPFMSHIGMLSVDTLALNCSTQSLAEYELWGNRSTSTAWTTPILYSCANGIVFVNVLNELQCGDATADAVIVAEMWMEDVHFASPRQDVLSGSGSHPSGVVANLSYTNTVIQGVEVPDGEAVSDVVPVESEDDYLSKLYSGEAVPSLRVLLHRTYFWRNYSLYTDATSSHGSMATYVFPRFPLPLHAKGFDYVDNLNTFSTTGMLTNYFNTTPIAYITACFTGHRGGMVWKSATTEAYSGKGAYFSALLKGGDITKRGVNNLYAGSTTNDNLRRRQISAMLGSITAGSSASHQSSNGVCSGLFPMYANWRMFPGNINSMYDSVNEGGYDGAALASDQVTWVGIKSASASFCDLMLSVSAATDFNVFGFVNVPDVYVQNTI
jgi:hypothetical protein